METCQECQLGTLEPRGIHETTIDTKEYGPVTFDLPGRKCDACGKITSSEFDDAFKAFDAALAEAAKKLRL